MRNFTITAFFCLSALFLTVACDDSSPSGTCVPTTEVCDGVDNDCNGIIDEDLTRDCDNSCGTGSEICSYGEWRNCSAPSPSTEICDGVDNDCDGTVDNGTGMQCARSSSRNCGSDEGTCAFGTELCTESCQWSGQCLGGTPAVEEICDGVDNDCDGVVDGTGAMQLSRNCATDCGTGTELCVGGNWMNCTAPQPAVEICDGVDNNCDGITDNGANMECARGDSRVCGTDTGECSTGTELCDNSCHWTGNCLGQIVAVTEVCDAQSKDEDCDGSHNEGCSCTNNTTQTCCGGSTVTCTGGAWPACPASPVETCDGLDNNCDGLVDNGLSLDIDEPNDTCAQARLSTMEEGDSLIFSSRTIYKADLTADVDYFQIELREMSDWLCFINPNFNECYSYYFSVTDPQGFNVEFDLIPIDLYATNHVAQCTAATYASMFHSTNGALVLNYDGRCGDDDDWRFYIKVRANTSGVSCRTYTLNVSVPVSYIQDDVCTDYPPNN